MVHRILSGRGAQDRDGRVVGVHDIAFAVAHSSLGHGPGDFTFAPNNGTCSPSGRSRYPIKTADLRKSPSEMPAKTGIFMMFAS